LERLPHAEGRGPWMLRLAPGPRRLPLAAGAGSCSPAETWPTELVIVTGRLPDDRRGLSTDLGAQGTPIVIRRVGRRAVPWSGCDHRLWGQGRGGAEDMGSRAEGKRVLPLERGGRVDQRGRVRGHGVTWPPGTGGWFPTAAGPRRNHRSAGRERRRRRTACTPPGRHAANRCQRPATAHGMSFSISGRRIILRG